MDASREPYGVAAVELSDGSHGSVSHTSRPLPRTGPALRPLARSIAARVNRVAQHLTMLKCEQNHHTAGYLACGLHMLRLHYTRTG